MTGDDKSSLFVSKGFFEDSSFPKVSQLTKPEIANQGKKNLFAEGLVFSFVLHYNEKQLYKFLYVKIFVSQFVGTRSEVASLAGLCPKELEKYKYNGKQTERDWLTGGLAVCNDVWVVLKSSIML